MAGVIERRIISPPPYDLAATGYSPVINELNIISKVEMYLLNREGKVCILIFATNFRLFRSQDGLVQLGLMRRRVEPGFSIGFGHHIKPNFVRHW
jgi:hypothetical protein